MTEVELSLSIFCFLVYGLSISFIFIYSLSQGHLTYCYLKKPLSAPIFNKALIPNVCIQLPIYNELYVAERLIDQICQLDWPKEKLEIQVLDDSTDQSCRLIDKKVHEWKSKGINIKVLRRQERIGFKAGALNFGLKQTRAELIAIFDADFLPRKDFLKKCVPYFEDSKVAMVQSRWEHLNKSFSILTRLQAFMLDAHFSIEQKGRNKGGFYINFNGTGGIWRRQSILDAGNWSSDTLTEDLDLSYRAQLKGWKFIYKEDLGSPAELPPVISAVKTQQYRWNKGAAETARKHLLKIWKTDISLIHKIHSSLHLLNSSLFIWILIISLFSVPLLYIKAHYPQFGIIYSLSSIFILSFGIISISYYISAKTFTFNNQSFHLFYFIKYYLLFLSLSMALALHNSFAVLEGYFGRKTSFIRTPKFNNTDSKTLDFNKYINNGLSFINLLEFCLFIYFIFGLLSALKMSEYSFLPIYLMLITGYGLITYYNFNQSLANSWVNRPSLT